MPPAPPDPGPVPSRARTPSALLTLGWSIAVSVIATSCLHRGAPPPKSGTAVATPPVAAPPVAAPPVATPPVAAHVAAATAGNTPAPAAEPAVGVPGSRVGTVRALGSAGRFVLVETSTPGAAAGLRDGQELRCVPASGTHSDEPFAILRISPERRPPFIVADVVSGQPHAADDVYTIRSSGAVSPPGPAASPSTTSFLLPAAARPPGINAVTPGSR